MEWDDEDDDQAPEGDPVHAGGRVAEYRAIGDLPWFRRRLAVRSARRMLSGVEGVRGIDRKGRVVWEPGHPKDDVAHE